MIKIIADDKIITAADETELKAKMADIFSFDPNDDVTLTYVVTRQPASRRMTQTT